MSHERCLSAFRSLKAKPPVDGQAHRIYVGGCSGSPIRLFRTLQNSPEDAANTVFLGVWIPGVNRLDWAGLHPTAKAETVFLSPEQRGSFEARKVSFRPLSYLQSCEWLSTTPLDGIVALTAPEAADGTLSLGVSQDFTGMVLQREEVPAIALTTPDMPWVRKGAHIPSTRFQDLVDTDAALLTVPVSTLDQRFSQVAAHVAELVDEGATVQFGLGNLQAGVLVALKQHRNLRIHSGMISDPVMELAESGALRSDKNAIRTGVALGTPALYEWAARDDRVEFCNVQDTHQLNVLEKIPQFTAINSVMEVDLFGQANAEFLGTRQVSGIGGLTNFLHGASRSEGGQAILGTLSTAKGGRVSRIVPILAPNATSIPRTDVQIVVTEHGVADLRYTDIDTRAERLVAIADPSHRAELANAWHAMRSAM